MMKSKDIPKAKASNQLTPAAIHKINNLLSTISSNAQYLSEKLKIKNLNNLTKKDLQDIRECIELIAEDSDKCNSYINQL